MNALELVELAAIVSHNSPTIARQSGGIDDSFVESYWNASKRRHDVWILTLRSPRVPEPESTEYDSVPSSDESESDRMSTGQCIEELLLSEPLTRVWSALMSAIDYHQPEAKLEPVTRGVYLGHQVVHHHALSILLDPKRLDHKVARHLNQLRKKVEIWCDLLIANMASYFPDAESGVTWYAIDPDKSLTTALELRRQRRIQGELHFAAMFQTMIRASLTQYDELASPTPELNRQIASAILSSFTSSLFDGQGVFRSSWMSRLLAVAQEAHIMIDEILEPEIATPNAPKTPHSALFQQAGQRFGSSPG